MKRFLRKKFLYTLFFSYLLFLLLCMAIGIILFRSSLTQIEQNAEQFNQIALSQTKNAVSQAEKDIRSQMDELHTRDAYPSLVYALDPISDSKLIQVADLQAEMVRQVAYSTYTSGIYIWFDNPQIAATTNGLFRTRESFDKMLLNKFGISFDQIAERAETNGNICIRALGENGVAKKLIAVISRGSGQCRSLEILELNMRAFQKLLTDEDQKGSSTIFWALVNADGLLIEPNQKQELALYVNSLSLSPETITRVQYEGEDMAVMRMDMENEFTLYSASSFSAYSEIYHNYMVVAVIYFAVYFAIGIFISFLFSKQNYRPIERINNILLDRTASSSEDGEFALMEAGINSLLKSSQEYSRIKIKEEKLMQEQCMVSLLRGELSEADFAKACAEYSLHFSSERFAVVGIAIRDYSNLFLDGKSNKEKDTLDIAIFAVSSVAGELLEECGSTYICRHDGKIWAVVSPLPAKGVTEQDISCQLRNCCQRSEMFLREQLGINTVYCFSRLSPASGGAAGIASVYQEALWGLEQIEGYGLESAVNSREDISLLLKPGKQPPAADIGTRRRQFFSAVISGDFEEAGRLYLELRRQDLAFADESFSAVRTQTLVLMGYLLSNLPQGCMEANSKEIDSYVLAIRREQYDDKLTALMGKWIVYFHNLYKEAEEKTKGEKEDAALLAVHYINDHYADADISVAMVAEHLSVSPSYLSRVFRKRFDLSVLDYIHRRRMDTAKVLLRESDITVEDVAKQVGYTNALALIRAFKRCENCTPTEYRKSLQK